MLTAFAIVLLTLIAGTAGLFLLSLATGLLGLIVVFPLLGHGTWHAWRAMNPAKPEPLERAVLA